MPVLAPNSIFMKTVYSFSTTFLAVATLVSSCAVSKNGLTDQKPATKQNTPQSGECIVEFKNGQVKKYSTLKLVTGMLQVPHLVADGKENIVAADIRSYTTSEVYAVSQTEFYPKAKSYVAKEVLPGFAKRVVKGSVNLYAMSMYNGHNVYEKFFIQSGDEGAIVPCTPEVLGSHVQDNSEITNYLNRKNKKVTSKEIVDLVTTYNSSVVFTK